MSKLLKVRLEYEDKIMEVEGLEAEKWKKNVDVVQSIAFSHGINPFETDPLKWSVLNVDVLAEKEYCTCESSVLNNKGDKCWQCNKLIK